MERERERTTSEECRTIKVYEIRKGHSFLFNISASNITRHDLVLERFHPKRKHFLRPDKLCQNRNEIRP
jgi:hypothetical protein